MFHDVLKHSGTPILQVSSPASSSLLLVLQDNNPNKSNIKFYYAPLDENQNVYKIMHHILVTFIYSSIDYLPAKSLKLFEWLCILDLS